MWESILETGARMMSKLNLTDEDRLRMEHEVSMRNAQIRAREAQNMAMIGNSTIGGPDNGVWSTGGSVNIMPTHTGTWNNWTEGTIGMRLEPIKNGYILHLWFEEGEIGEKVAIKDISEIEEQIVAAKAARRMK